MYLYHTNQSYQILLVCNNSKQIIKKKNNQYKIGTFVIYNTYNIRVIVILIHIT